MRKTSCVLFEQDVGFVANPLSLPKITIGGLRRCPLLILLSAMSISEVQPIIPTHVLSRRNIGKCRRTSLSPEPAKIRYLSIFFVRRQEVVAGRTLMLCVIRLLASFEWPIVSNGSCKLRPVFRGFEYQLSSNLRYMITGCRDKSKSGVWRMIRQWPIKLLSFINNRPFGRPVLYI